MGYIEDQVKKINEAKARGDNTEAAKIVAHYLLEGGLNRSEQEKFMDDLRGSTR